MTGPSSEHLQRMGDALFDALHTRRAIAPLIAEYPDMDIDAAYTVQQHLMARRLASGERVVGKKIGVTSRAVMDLLGVFQPDFGWLTDRMVYNEGESIPSADLIQPKAEGEVAFLLKKTLKGPGVTREDVLDATDGVMACFTEDCVFWSSAGPHPQGGVFEGRDAVAKASLCSKRSTSSMRSCAFSSSRRTEPIGASITHSGRVAELS